MSAWLTSDVHRSAIVQAAVVEQIIDPSEANDLWLRMTWDNHYALHCRYGDELPAEEYTELECNRSAVEHPLNPYDVLKLISCWNYQCAEFDGWDRTVAHITVNRLWTKLLADLGHPDYDDLYAQRRYHSAPWGVASWKELLPVNA